jgi:DNA-binding NarL/FixJ family response regulator
MSTTDAPHRTNAVAPRRLTKRQMSVVRELADGCDIAMVAAHRDRGVSSVYEIVGRICDRWGLDDWREIGPFALEQGLANPGDRENPESSG